MLQDRSASLLVAAAALLFAVAPVNAQCKTGNCQLGATIPAACQNRATPRSETVQMTNFLQFAPNLPRIEGGSSVYQCIRWQTAALTHASTEGPPAIGFNGQCDSTGLLCAAINPASCDWETGNVTGAIGSGTCHYASVGPGGYPFHCRFHEPNMIGTLTIVNPIRLTVDKNAAGDALLNWAVGGGGPWNVWKDSSPPMPVASRINLTPGGTALRVLTDLAPPGDNYYLIIERN